MAVTEGGRTGWCFLRKIIAGAASRSYGSRWRGWPDCRIRLLRRAREILANLEAQELDETGRPGSPPAAQAGALSSLFEAPRLPPAPPPSPSKRHCAALDLTRTTPLDALLWRTISKKKLPLTFFATSATSGAPVAPASAEVVRSKLSRPGVAHVLVHEAPSVDLFRRVLVVRAAKEPDPVDIVPVRARKAVT